MAAPMILRDDRRDTRRASSRPRRTPLQYWSGERVIYESIRGDLSVVDVLKTDPATRSPARRAAPRRRGRPNAAGVAVAFVAAAARSNDNDLDASQQTLRSMGGKLIALGLATSLGRSLGLLLPLARLAHEASTTLSALTSEDVTVRRVAWSAALLSCSGGKCAAIYALTHMVGLYSSLAMSCALSGALLLGASFTPPQLDQVVRPIFAPLLPLLGTMNQSIDAMLAVERRTLQQIAAESAAPPALAAAARPGRPAAGRGSIEHPADGGRAMGRAGLLLEGSPISVIE